MDLLFGRREKTGSEQKHRLSLSIESILRILADSELDLPGRVPNVVFPDEKESCKCNAYAGTSRDVISVFRVFLDTRQIVITNYYYASILSSL